jgi:hypothetical protein
LCGGFYFTIKNKNNPTNLIDRVIDLIWFF